MKKKMFVILILLIPTLLFADLSWYDVSVGLSIGKKIGDVADLDERDLFDLESYEYKAEIRTKLLFTEVDIVGIPLITSTGALEIKGLFLFGFTDYLFNIAKISLCIGPEFNYVNNGDLAYLKINGTEVPANSFKDLFTESTYTFRAGIDFMLGDVMKMGVSYTLPTSYSVDTGDLNLLVPNSENWKDGKISLSILMSLV